MKSCSSVHSSNVLSLQHLAWNKMLLKMNPTTVYCPCRYGPKFVICAECAKQLFLIQPASSHCDCGILHGEQCRICKRNSDLTLGNKSIENCMK